MADYNGDDFESFSEMFKRAKEKGKEIVEKLKRFDESAFGAAFEQYQQSPAYNPPEPPAPKRRKGETYEI